MAVTDKLTAVEIKASLIADRTIGLMDIEVEVHDGIAVLTGEVETDEQRRKAGALAHKVEGITRVDNRVKVVQPTAEQAASREGADAHLGYGPAEGSVGDTAFSIAGEYSPPGPGLATSEQFAGQFTDEEIQEEIERALRARNDVDVSGVQVQCENQIAHAKGTVKTNEDLNALQDLLLKVRGVMGVISDVTVQEGDIGTPVE